MGVNKAADDFNAIITAGRERRENEKLAANIFSKHRRASAPAAGQNKRNASTGGSLASRVGVQKRPAASAKTTFKPSSRNVNEDWTHDLYNPDNSRPGNSRQRSNKAAAGWALDDSKISSSPDLRSQVNIIDNRSRPSGLSIRGIAGNCTVVVQNLAPGTTAADIETAFGPIGGVILRCQVVSSQPAVTAEIVFETKEGAVNVVESFNNRTADGRVIRVSIKQSSATSPFPPTGPRSSRETERRNNQLGNIVDGSYGFSDKMETDEDHSDMAQPRQKRDQAPRSYRGRRDGGRAGRGGFN